MPDQKVIAIGILCLALIASVVLYSKRDYFFNGAQASLANSTSVISTSTVPTTTDDWEKLLNITVATGTPTQIIGQSNTTDSDDEDNLTAQLSKNYFALYLQDEKNGVTVDQNEADNIAQEAISGINVPIPKDKYGVSDIQTTKDTSLSSVTQYENAIVQSVQNSGLSTSENEMNIVYQATQSGNQSDLDKLDPIIAGYQKLIASTLHMTVPQNAIGIHIVYLNTLNDLLVDIQGLQQILNDPVAGYVAFTSYQKDSTKLSLIINDMDTYFSAQLH